MKKKFQTPVVLFIFNRPDLVSIVFEKIAKLQPALLFIVSDGARADREGEESLVKECRKIATDTYWGCEIYCNFSDVNMGCKNRISTGIDWVFSHVKTAIFLEDDCYPDDSFFGYCEELLEKFRDDERISIINGTNHIANVSKNYGADYYFSKYPHIWGWASWSHKWIKNYDVNMSDWPRYKKLELLKFTFKDKSEVIFWTNYFDQVFLKKIDTWDFQVSYMNFSKNLLAIAPTKNLISNIGFNRSDATHTTSKSPYAELKTYQVRTPLLHPAKLEQNKLYDNIESTQYRHHLLQAFIRKLYYKFRQRLSK